MNGTMDDTGTYKKLEDTSGTMVSCQIKQEPLKEGYLQKQNGWLQGWKLYYFQVYCGKICYKNSKSTQEFMVNKICVAECSVNNFNNSFEVIIGNLELILSTDTRKDMEEWITAFKMCAQKNSELTEVQGRMHRWYSCSHNRPTFCNVCKQLLYGVTAKGLSCEVCRFKSHKSCASNAPRSCKWTTLDNIPLEVRYAGSTQDMPHQWIIGNIVDKKCAFCLKPCGSRKALQDYTCLWCDYRVHEDCKADFEKNFEKCTLGHNSFSIIKPISIKQSSKFPDLWESASTNNGSSPLIVFVNSKSGDNQGVRFMRRFKQILNPAQVFDLSVAGPAFGLTMCKQFEQFRILVCGGDGSVGWVMTELDKQDLTNKCQLGVLPLGTGNDLARVLGWGTSCYDVSLIPHILKQLEHAKPCMLDRWSISIKEFSSIIPKDCSYFGYEDSIIMQITRMLATNDHGVVLQSAKMLYEIFCHFVEFVKKSTLSIDEDKKIDSDSLKNKCLILQNKLETLFQTLKIESNSSLILSKSWPKHERPVPDKCRSNTMENVELSSCKNLGEKKKYHSDITLTEDDIKKSHSSIKFISKEHLWSRANSLKSALRDIIDHTEKVLGSQETVEAINNSNMTNNKLDIRPNDVCNGIEPIENELQKKEKNISGNPNATVPQSSPFLNLQNIAMRCKKTSNTVVFPGTVIARAFQKPDNCVSFISKAILANTSAICATAVAGMEGHEQIKNFNEKCVMNNYFGIGIDAKIALDFHNKREEHPEKYRSRTKNMIWYGVLGGKEIVNRTYRNLDQNVHLEVDGHKINLPSLQGIVVLNIQSYIGGSNFWGTKKELDGFTLPSFDDKMLEVVAVLGASQMGMSKVFGGMQHHRISQCHSVKITITDEEVPVQVDGEAWMQPPGIIQIIHKNRATMLKKDRDFEEALRSWNEPSRHCKCNYRALSGHEVKLLKPVAIAVLVLVKNVKAASLINDVHQELYELASSLKQMAEKFQSFNSTCNTQEAAEFLTLSKSFINEVNEKLWISKPMLSEELEYGINSALKKANQELNFYYEQFENKDSDDEMETSSQLSNNKMMNSFNRNAVSCRFFSPSDAYECLDKKSLTDWTSNDVSLWLDKIGYGEYKDIFFTNKIRSGRELIGLNEKDLTDFGISHDKVKHIINQLKDLKHTQKTKTKWTRKTVL
ncbi:diacylglycerol kinase eta isoform X3 [Hydra vulgaris]|uniref:diacylglycerol kinase eta isoform X3 n=1 Tax=Hydra vulgaris TaxID=6087 RepID=UPI001F5F25D4|nr:diacylglycerol kinase eta isoform X2 [Hydra vulgaris]